MLGLIAGFAFFAAIVRAAPILIASPANNVGQIPLRVFVPPIHTGRFERDLGMAAAAFEPVGAELPVRAIYPSDSFPSVVKESGFTQGLLESMEQAAAIDSISTIVVYVKQIIPADPNFVVRGFREGRFVFISLELGVELTLPHEIGHRLGLDHNPNPRHVMCDGKDGRLEPSSPAQIRNGSRGRFSAGELRIMARHPLLRATQHLIQPALLAASDLDLLQPSADFAILAGEPASPSNDPTDLTPVLWREFQGEPVPEPGTFNLGAAALVALAARMLRSKR